MRIESFKELRNKKKLSTKQLAKLTDIDENDITKSETNLGSLDSDIFYQLLKFYKIDKSIINICTDRNLLILD